MRRMVFALVAVMLAATSARAELRRAEIRSLGMD